jgi:hypothetical protein
MVSHLNGEINKFARRLRRELKAQGWGRAPIRRWSCPFEGQLQSNTELPLYFTGSSGHEKNAGGPPGNVPGVIIRCPKP